MTFTPFNINIDAIDKARCEKDYMYFVERAWPVLEGGKFKSGKHIEAIAYHLELCIERKIQRLLTNCPPRCSKTMLISTMLHPFWWTREPHLQILGASYGAELTTEAAVNSRNLIESAWYQDRWGSLIQLDHNQNQKDHYRNTLNGRRQSTSVTGKTTGMGGNLLILDDPHNVAEGESEVMTEKVKRWYREAWSSRINDPEKGVKIVIMQRISDKDLSGFLLNESAEKYHHLCLPMYWSEDTHCRNVTIGYEDPRKKLVEEDPDNEENRLLWPDHINMKAYQDLKDSFGAYGSAGQLDQRPAPREGGLIKSEYFEVYDLPPGRMKKYVRGWDMATTNTRDHDWSVGVLVGQCRNNYYWILDIKRFKATIGKVNAQIKKCALADPADTQIIIEQEPGSSGKYTAQIQKQELVGHNVRHLQVNKDKITRFMPVLPYIEVGKVRMIRASWNADFLSEASVWPGGKFDDQVDALGLALSHLCTAKQILVA